MDKLLKVAVIISAVDQMSKVVKGATDKSIKEMERLNAARNKMFKGAAMIGAGAAGFAALAMPVQSAADFESKMADVRKVVSGLNDPTALAEFSGEIQKLGREIGISTSELVDLAAAGGRMDIPKQELIAYVREVSKMSVAFDMAAGDVGENMGKIAKMFDIPVNQISRLGDAINYLDDNAIAKGSEIMDVMLRAAGTAKQVGIADEKLAALASTFLTLGSRPEVAATSINALMRELAIAEIQPKRFQAGLEKLGISAQQMQKMMKLDPQNTILKVLDAIKKNPNGVTLSTQLFGKEYGDDIAKLATGVGEYRRQLGLLNEAGKQGSMGREFNIRNATFNSEMQKFSNIIQELKVNFGTALLPMLKDFAETLKPIASGLANFAKEHPNVMKFVAVLVSLASAGLVLAGVIAVVNGALLLLSANPIVLIVAAFIAGIVALVMFRKEINAFIDSVVNWFAVKLTALGAWIKENWKMIVMGILAPWTLVFRQVLTLLKNFAPEMYEAGKNIVDSIINGITAKAEALYGKVKELAKGIRDFFPFSPAKRGPLMDIHKIKFAETIALAMKPQPLMKAAGAMAGAMASGGRSVSPRGGGGGGITFAPVIHLNGGATKADANMLIDQMKPLFKKLLDDASRGKARLSY